MENTVIKFGDIEKKKQKSHQGSTSIKNVDIDKIVVPNKVHFGKIRFKYFIGYKDTKKLNLYVHFSQKWLHTEKTLIKLNSIFFSKR